MADVHCILRIFHCKDILISDIILCYSYEKNTVWLTDPERGRRMHQAQQCSSASKNDDQRVSQATVGRKYLSHLLNELIPASWNLLKLVLMMILIRKVAVCCLTLCLLLVRPTNHIKRNL